MPVGIRPLKGKGPERPHLFLEKGGVFTEDLIEEWIRYKRTKEIDVIRLGPHPCEVVLYHDI